MTGLRLPVIDLHAFRADEARDAQAARALDQAFREHGFAYISNTGIAAHDLERVFAASRAFHALPAPSKLALGINEFHRGYIAPASSVIRSSSVAEVRQPNLSDSFMAMHELGPDDPRYGEPLQGPNQWPSELPGFRTEVLHYMALMSAMASRLTALLARALGLPEGALLDHFEQPTVWLRLLHYPPHPATAPDDQYGAAPHTDYGFITILAQDERGGLEVRGRNGEWFDAPPVPGAFVLNVADMLARWTNDRWTSTPHRVRNLTGHHRYSVPFFWDPSMGSEIRCLPGCEGAEGPRYEAVRFGDYVMSRLNRNYAYRQPGA